MAAGLDEVDGDDLVSIADALHKLMGRAFLAANRDGQLGRENLYGLSVSSLGGCPKQAAYRFGGAVPSNPEFALNQQARAAMIGVWIHAGFLPYVGALLAGSKVEMKVRLPVRLPGGALAEVLGSCDLYSPAAGGGVIDLKTKRAYGLGDIEWQGAQYEHEMQVRGYATAVRRAGLPVRWIAWVYMDRSTGEFFVMVKKFGQAEVDATDTLVRKISVWALDPDTAPRTVEENPVWRAPGIAVECDSCPWLKRCWGPDAKPGDPSVLEVHSNPEIAEAARRLVDLRDQKKAIEKEMEYVGAQLGRPATGVYGEAEVVYGKAGTRHNQKKAEALLEQLGVDRSAYRDEQPHGSRIVRRTHSTGELGRAGRVGDGD